MAYNENNLTPIAHFELAKERRHDVTTFLQVLERLQLNFSSLRERKVKW